MAKEEMINLQRLEDYSADMFRDANVLKRNTAYALNNVVCKGLIILKCILAGTTNTTALSLSGVSVGDELTDGTAKWKVISVNGYGTGGGTSISNWQANTVYAVGDMVINDNKLYQCITAHTSTSTFDGSKWQLIGDYMIAPCKVGEVGYVSWQYALLENHLALNGATVTDFNALYPELYDFFDDNNLITTVQADYDANHALLLYDSSTDTATMPNFLSKTVWGGSTVEEKEAGLPNIKGSMSLALGAVDGAFYREGTVTNNGINPTGSYAKTNFAASRSSSIYKDSVNTVQPPAIQLIPQIRYKKDTVEGSVGDFYNDTPIGTVISYMGTTPPREYIACDGTVYNISTYQALADFINDTFGSYDYFGGDGVTTFGVPDLRGEFLRGTGTNSHTNQGSGSNVGSHQDGTQHLFDGYNPNGAYLTYDSGQSWITPTKADSSYNAATNYTYYNKGGKGVESSANVYYTSRPTNTSVLYCIKYTVATKPQSLRDWTTDTFYSVGDFVIENNTMYRCIVDHVSTVFDTDLSADKWELVTSGGSGSGLQVVNSYNPVFEEAKGVEYSTEERRIGTWIDGKPLYQITIVDTMPTVTTDLNRVSKNIDISSLYINKVIRISGTVQSTEGWEELNSANNITPNGSAYRYCGYVNSSNSLFLATSWLLESNAPCYITLQYTKTTD